jgi:periplasmic protein TonB
MNSHAVIEDAESDRLATKEAAGLVTTNVAVLPTRRKALFEDSLLETSGGQRKRKTWATIFSLILQCILVGILIFIPLLYTDVLPKQRLVTFLVAPPPPPPPAPPHPAAVKVIKVSSEFVNGELRAPTRIPKKILMIKETEVPLPAAGVVGGVPGGIPGGQLGGVIGGIIGSLSRAPVLAKPATPRLVRVSQGVTEGLLLRRIQPPYPVIAREARIQGAVVLTAIIAKDGTIKNLQLVSGSPMLAPAAIDAVKQWRYKPYLLNGQPVEVETTVTINFSLGGLGG